ncbi:DUF6712 family protein [Hymenobacter rubidus]|uniref:DUF6712 family protein n=1 Tax=Hymenobacter rubidus TaxID=1441626 RepID=UPI00191E368E|nr:DUF6712 family protein [Hymenobacter rubidus]
MALLNTPAELKQYVSLDVSQVPPALALALREVENTTLALMLGKDLRAWLQAQYDAPDFSPTADSLAAELLRRVQRPIARLGVAAGLAEHQVSIDNTGIHILTTETSKTAFQWQTNQLRTQLEQRGQGDLDALVQWLEENRDASDELRAWAASEAGQRHRRELFTSTADFQQYENISAARPVFLALGPVRRRLEAFELARVLGPDLLQELREQVRARNLSLDNQHLLRTYVLPALASLTVGHAIVELGLKLTGDGIELMVARLDDSNSKEADAGLDQLMAKRSLEALATGARYLRQLTRYLDRTASATRFAPYFHSAAYTAPAPPAARALTAKTFRFC